MTSMLELTDTNPNDGDKEWSLLQHVIWNFPKTNTPELIELYNHDPNRSLEQWIQACTSEDATTVTFPDGFNMPLGTGNFPEGIDTIIFGQKFCQQLEAGVFPTTIRKIIFGRKFGRKKAHTLPIGVFPEGLLLLRFVDYATFNIKIEPNVLPSTLLFLEIGSKYMHMIGPNILPDSLETFIGDVSFTDDFKFPPNLKNLKTGSKLNLDINLTCTSLSKIEHLFLYPCNQPLEVGAISDTCIELTLNNYAVELVPGVLPSNLKKLFMTGYTNYWRKNVIPESVESFVLREDRRDCRGMTDEERTEAYRIYFPKNGNMKFLWLSLRQVGYDEDEDGGNFYNDFEDYDSITFY